MLFLRSRKLVKNTGIINSSLAQKFHYNFRWNLIGSLLYEVAKTAHNYFLFKLFHASIFGLMGSILSLIYLTTKYADFGMTYALPPFFNDSIRSKADFRKILLGYFLLPQLPIICLAAAIGSYFFIHKFCEVNACPSVFVVPIIIILETLRWFLRHFLHMAFKSRRIVQCEVVSFLTYLISVWAILYIYDFTPSLNVIFMLHVIESAVIVGLFMGMLFRFYRSLPNVDQAVLPQRFMQRFLEARFFNYTLRISREFFTSNFLTVFFALKFDVTQAALFYFAGTIGTSIQSIVKVAIGYSGNALFANLKHATHAEKKEAFGLLSEKLVRIIVPMLVVMIIVLNWIVCLGQMNNALSVTVAMLLLYLIIIFTEFFFILYEQFYIIEEASKTLFLFKMLEFFVFYGSVLSKSNQSTITSLIAVIGIRLASFACIAIHAFYRWNIRPELSLKTLMAFVKR